MSLSACLSACLIACLPACLPAYLCTERDLGSRTGMRMLFAKDCTLQHMGMYEMQSADVTHEHRVEFLQSVESNFEKW